MAIYDCFQFFNEEHILDLRLNILNEFVDFFVMVESTTDHQGNPKKLNFDLKKFKKFDRKIIYIVVDDTSETIKKPHVGGESLVEQHQRNSLTRGLKNCCDDDLIILSDVDEIPDLNKLNKKKSIAMFCTGGIRCEKASVFLKKKGFENVYQLKGGILNYLKKIKNNESLWRGECFVFDSRISVKHGLITGTYSMCSGCRKPISSKDKKSKKFEEGVSCDNCHDNLTKDQKERFRMRQRQINLAKKTGTKHIFQKEFN